jgi:hypothetical protein
MYLNLIGLGLLSLFIGALVYYSLTPVSLNINPVRSGLLVAQDTGKTKQIVSKIGDASMVTEKTRRCAIKNNYSYRTKFKSNLGSSSGALETFFITGVCGGGRAPCPPDIIFDGGGAGDEFCPVEGDIIYDAGGVGTIVCDT